MKMVTFARTSTRPTAPQLVSEGAIPPKKTFLQPSLRDPPKPGYENPSSIKSGKA
jgi:hypothetical protein